MGELENVLAQQVRRLRLERGWTQEEIADRVGLSSRYIGSIERGRVSVTLNVLAKLAQTFGIAPGDLIAME